MFWTVCVMIMCKLWREWKRKHTSYINSPVVSQTLSARHVEARLLRHSLESLKSSDVYVKEPIFRDMIMGVPYWLYRVRIVWNLINDADPLGRVISNKLETVIRCYIEGKGLPSFSREVVNGHSADGEGF